MSKILNGIPVKKDDGVLAPYVMTESGKDYVFHPNDFMENFKKTLKDIKKDGEVAKTLFLPEYYFHLICG